MAAVAAPLPVIPVQVPVHPRPADTPVYLPDDDLLVVATPFLPWQAAPAVGAGGPTRASLATYQMVKAFGTRCKVSRLPADLTAARAAHLLNLCLTAGFWSRVLTAIRDAGLANGIPIADIRGLRARLRGLNIPPNQLLVVAADWSLAPAFVIPQGAGAAALATRASLTDIRFLSLASIPLLEQNEDPVEPWAIIGELAGAFGAVLTQAARADEIGTLQTAAAHLKAYQPRVIADGPLATGLRTFVANNQLPVLLRSASLDSVDLADDLLDGLRYRAERAAVEEKRIHLLTPS